MFGTKRIEKLEKLAKLGKLAKLESQLGDIESCVEKLTKQFYCQHRKTRFTESWSFFGDKDSREEKCVACGLTLRVFDTELEWLEAWLAAVKKRETAEASEIKKRIAALKKA